MSKRLFHYSLAFSISLFLTLFMYRFGVLDKFEYITYDWRVQALSSSKPSSENIVEIVIDQFSLDWMDKEQGIGWPWPREIYGAINSFAKEGGAKAVVYDMLFSEGSVYSKADDDSFADTLKLLPTVGAVVLGSENYGQKNWPKYLSLPVVNGCSVSEESESLVLPTQGIDKAFTLLGVANALPDSDGVIRRVKLCHMFNGIKLPSLALASYQYLYPNDISLTKSEVFINYHKAPFSYTTYNAASLIQSWNALAEGNEPTLNPNILKDKVVFVGVSASGLFDQRTSGLSKNHPGLDIQATIFDNLVSHTFIKPLSFVYTLLYMLLFGAITTWMMMHASRWKHFIFPVIVIPLFILVLGYMYYFYDFWLNITLLFSTVFLIVILTGILGYLLEGRQKRYLRTAFSHYVSPSIVDKLVQYPEQLKLGGESRELSIFFSDIEGFTSVSERLKPELLIEMLHEYLENLSTIIMDFDGTIDKYEGDAIIAFWNAPLDTKEHETLAVKAALACQKRLSQMNPGFKKKYGVELKTRIGINTGKVIVGNLGSKKHFDYSFIGDAGNLAARLEGVNKVFGTDILVSKATRDKINNIEFRKIGTIKVVGRGEAVEVYQPLHEKNEYEELFTKALALFESYEFEESKKVFTSFLEFDNVAEYYLNIIREIENKRLTFDGAIVLGSK
jgi:adenylate cyclase